MFDSDISKRLDSSTSKLVLVVGLLKDLRI